MNDIPVIAPVIEVTFSEQEAHYLMTVLTQTPLPYNASSPLIHRVGQALASYQNLRKLGMTGAGVGPRVEKQVPDEATPKTKQ